MTIRLLLLILLLGGCAKGAEKDLPAISEARSLAAEWAKVNALAAEGRVNGTYVAAMHQQLHQQLQSAAAMLMNPDSDYGKEIQGLVEAAADTPAAELQAHSDKLKQIEDSLESA